MTNSATNYIQKITTTGQSNPSWAITFPVYDEKDIWVWKNYTATNVLEKLTAGEHYTLGIDGSTATLYYIGTTDNFTTSTLRVQRQMERVQQDEFRTGDKNTTTLAYEQTLDKLSVMNQQSIGNDPRQQKDWTAGYEYAEDTYFRDRISNVNDGTATTDAVNKSQVDTALGDGASPPTIASADVGQWATANSAGAFSWEPFTGTSDPKGHYGKHLTKSGWVDIDAYLPPITGSGDNNKLLMDISGTPTWTTANEYLTSFDDSPSSKARKPYSVVTHSGGRVPSVREYSAAPKLLPNEQGKKLTALETGYSAAENKLEFGRTFCITEHSVSCSIKAGTNQYYSGMVPEDATYGSDHPVYVGTIPNITGVTSAVPFFTSHLHEIPNDGGNGPTATRWFNYNTGGGQGSTGIENCNQFGFWFNIITVTTSTVTFAACSMLHEWGNSLHDNEIGNSRFLVHPDTITINFNVMWYQQKS